jgi:hypothetical protein
VTAPRGAGSSGGQGLSSGARGALVIGSAVILGIIGLQILDDSGGPGTRTAVVADGSGTVTTQPASASTSTAVRKNAKVRVKVYNASGVQGTAQTMTDKLKALGYNMQPPANLSTKSSGTSVQCVEGFKAEATLLAIYGVGSPAVVQPYAKNPPAGASDADCIVIIGTA